MNDMAKHRLVTAPGNSKLGGVVKTYSTRDTCPKTCPFLKKGCFGENSYQKMQWDKVHETGMTLREVIDELGNLPLHTKTRINIVGDHLLDIFGNLCTDTLAMYSQVVKRRKLEVLNYCHHVLSHQNILAAKVASFVINFSTERIDQAVYAIQSGVNAVITLPSNTTQKVIKTPDITIMVCPTHYRNVTCEQCMLCAQDRVKRKLVIGFISHGTRKKQIDLAIEKQNNFQLALDSVPD
jgi:hypothetical protein